MSLLSLVGSVLLQPNVQLLGSCVRLHFWFGEAEKSPGLVQLCADLHRLSDCPVL